MVVYIIICSVTLILAIIGNAIAMDGVVNGRITLKGYRRFLISILVSDIYICVVKGMFFVRQAATFFTEIDPQVNTCFYKMERSLEMTGFIAYLLNLCGMFFDHFIGIVYPTHYREMVNHPVAQSLVFVFWTIALLICLADHPIRTTIEYFVTPTANPKAPLLAQMPQLDNCSFVQPAALSPGSGFSPVTNDLFVTTADPSDLTKNHLEQTTTPVLISDDNFDDGLSDTFQPILPGRSGCNESSLASFVDAYINFMNQPVEEESNANLNWCSHYDRNYHVSLDWIVLALALGSIIFMAFCHVIFQNKVRSGTGAGRTREKLRKLVITTLLLLGSFCLCWVPFVGYEIAMVLFFQVNNDARDGTVSLEAHMRAHDILYFIFMCSPMIPPFVFICRMSAVKKYLIRKYACTGFTWLARFDSEVEKEQAEKTLMPNTTAV